MSDAVAIFGTGGFAREVACLLHDLGRGDRIVAFHEPDEVFRARELLGVPVRPQSAFDPVRGVELRPGADAQTDAQLDAFIRAHAESAYHPCGTCRMGEDAHAVVDAPLIIADGLRGRSETAVAVHRKRFQTVYIASEIVQADALVSVAHFKGHELSGFGGTLKNLGMGCASRRGKLAQHSKVNPKIVKKKCIGCGECVQHCSQEALSLFEEKALIDAQKCIGCGECILICPSSAIQIEWNQAIPVFLENMVEYTEGVLKGKQNKTLFVNFITDVSPACDCYGHNDAPVVRDIGILASRDPVAIDQASVDLVNREVALPESSLTVNRAAGEDKFRGIYPQVDWTHQLDYAEKIGLGSRAYQLEKI